MNTSFHAAMKTLRLSVIFVLVASLTSPALAGDLQSSIAKAANEAAAQAPSTLSAGVRKGYVWSGVALLVGGLGVSSYGFLRYRNTDFPEFGEADARNYKLGSAGLAAAFAGGALLALGTRSTRSPSVTVGPQSVAVSKHLSW